MKKLRLHSLLLMVFAVAACRGGDSGVIGAAADPFVTLSSNPTPNPAPSPAPIPAPVAATQSSLLPFIDNAKIPAPEGGFNTARIMPATVAPSQNTDGTGQFRFTCDFSHMSYDDPIVFPGKQGAAHLHAFFGNTGINYASTQQSIETTGGSTCAGGTANRTGYWVPAVIDTKDGTPIKPSSILVYYKSGTIEGKIVQPFPAGLRMIAGDMKSSAPQERVGWGCSAPPPGEERSFVNIPASCPVGWTVKVVINFPECWDGVNLDSPDHKSHMSYLVWNNDKRIVECPTTHPVLVPQISEMIQYKVVEEGSTARWRLASDNYSKDLPGGYSIHADWFNGWDPRVQDIWVKNCLQAKRDCHAFLLGDGTTLF